ncbi:MAG: hypothetical protein AAGF97_20095, partial [Planctomycetota bacterium]
TPAVVTPPPAAATTPATTTPDAEVAPAAESPRQQASLADLLLDEGKPPTPEPVPMATPLDDSRLAALGLRKLTGKHLVLITDLPSDPEIDALPEVFDAAVPLWRGYFQLPPSATDEWQLTGYLMQRPEPFREAGYLPDSLPPFLHGYQSGDQLWVREQPSGYYRRHLLLHEGVHGIMRHALGGTGPPWYREGMAEMLATHRWKEGKLTVGIMPRTKQEVPSWGRIKLIRDEFAADRALMLKNVSLLADSDFLEPEAYAWSWGACAFLDGHPRFRDRFRAMQNQVQQSPLRFNQLLGAAMADDAREMDEQWQLFVINADYGYDFARNAVRYAEGEPFPIQGVTVDLETNRGWQSTGYRLLSGKSYVITAKGRYQIHEDGDSWMCEPNGITLRYYAGRPLGMLMGTIRLDDPGLGVARLGRPISIGLRRRIEPVESGTLYLKVNDHPAELEDNLGTLTVRIEEE